MLCWTWLAVITDSRKGIDMKLMNQLFIWYVQWTPAQMRFMAALSIVWLILLLILWHNDRTQIEELNSIVESLKKGYH